METNHLTKLELSSSGVNWIDIPIISANSTTNTIIENNHHVSTVQIAINTTVDIATLFKSILHVLFFKITYSDGHTKALGHIGRPFPTVTQQQSNTSDGATAVSNKYTFSFVELD